MKISSRVIGKHVAPYVIAELSGNHNGSIDNALRLIEAAAKAGADAVKLQTYTADTITIKSDRPEFVIQGGLWDGKTLYELYDEAHTPWEWHPALYDKARAVGIDIFSSPFDNTAVDFLEELGTPAYKIASPEIIDIPLIERVAATGKPMIISTGMATPTEVDEAISAARSAGAKDLVLLHCVSAYPAQIEDMNLSSIPEFARKYDVVAGLSDHSLGTLVATAAVALGACVIEKHITLSRDEGGVDSAFSLEPGELQQLVHDVRLAHRAIGNPREETFEAEKISLNFRRSLYVVEDVAEGELFSTENVRSIRPGFGMKPNQFKRILGTKAHRNVEAGEPLNADMLAGFPGLFCCEMPRINFSPNSYIRPISSEDITSEYVSGLNDPEVNRFLTGPRQECQTGATVAEFVDANWTANDALLFGLFVDGTLCGTSRLHDIIPSSAYIGLAIFNKKVWGQGWGGKLVVAITRYALNDLGVRAVRAGIELENTASQKAFLKAGFTPVSVLDSETSQVWECQRL